MQDLLLFLISMWHKVSGRLYQMVCHLIETTFWKPYATLNHLIETTFWKPYATLKLKIIINPEYLFH